MNLKKNFIYSYTGLVFAGLVVYIATFAAEIAVLGIIRHISGESVGPVFFVRHLLVFPFHFPIYALVPVSLTCLYAIISNLSLVRHEGFRMGNLLGVPLAVAYLGSILGLWLISGRLVKVSLYLTQYLWVMLSYWICVFFGTMIMGYNVTRSKVDFDKDYVIILGCSISKTGGLRPLLKERANRAILFAWDQERATGKPVLYVPSGGKGSDEIISEASAMELYIVAHSAEFDEVFPEKESRNTYENMLFSKRIIDGLKPNAKIAYVTTNYHVLRSGMLARIVGLDAQGIASRTKWYFWPNGFIREFVAIVVMKRNAHVTVMMLCAVLIGVINYVGSML